MGEGLEDPAALSGKRLFIVLLYTFFYEGKTTLAKYMARSERRH